MTTWSSGYVADIGYTYGYYNELDPNRAKLALLHAGFKPPSSGVHCELGFGQGLSVNIHAAASGSTWYGTDFNPSQAVFAQTLATASGADVHLTDEAFADFCNRSDLPEFDSIGLHGIWSWISDENRSTIVDFIRRKLKVGGALYISYNTQPGWATFAPLRYLMTEHAAIMGSTGKGVVSRVDGALEFAQKLLDTNPLFARFNSGVVDRLKQVAEQDRNYLAHEYFNKDWHPMHFATMSQWLSPAKVSFACSAQYLDHIDTINLTTEQQVLLIDIPDPTFKETVRDFMVNQQFRRDYWIKGARKISVLEQAELVLNHRVVLVNNRQDILLKTTGALGEATLSKLIYEPIIDLMSDHAIRSISDIGSKLKNKTIGFPQVVQAVMVLIGAGHMASVQTEEQIKKGLKSTKKLNLSVIDSSQFSSDILFLASSVTGAGVPVNRIQQLFLNSIAKGMKTPHEWANAAWLTLSSQNQRLLKDGKTMDTDTENLAELVRQAEEFITKKLPILKALLVV